MSASSAANAAVVTSSTQAAVQTSTPANADNSHINRDADPKIIDLLLNEVNADKIREYLK